VIGRSGDLKNRIIGTHAVAPMLAKKICEGKKEIEG